MVCSCCGFVVISLTFHYYNTKRGKEKQGKSNRKDKIIVADHHDVWGGLGGEAAPND